jgi:hypothetical protein
MDKLILEKWNAYKKSDIYGDKLQAHFLIIKKLVKEIEPKIAKKLMYKLAVEIGEFLNYKVPVREGLFDRFKSDPKVKELKKQIQKFLTLMDGMPDEYRKHLIAGFDHVAQWALDFSEID